MPESLENSESASFVVSGAAFIRARKNLKPAYPKKKQSATAIVGFVSTSPTEVSIQLAGASAKMPAIVSTPFNAQMPWLFFQQLVTAAVDEAASRIDWEQSLCFAAICGDHDITKGGRFTRALRD